MRLIFRLGLLASALGLILASANAQAAAFSVADALSYPFVPDIVSAPRADRIAWIRVVKGVRNVWVADAPTFAPRQVTSFSADDGQELTQLTFSPDGSALLFVRGGDHDANWAAKGGLEPDPDSSPSEPKVTLWLADPLGIKPAVKLVEGDAPALSSRGELAYVKAGQVWTAKLDGKEGSRLFFDRGKDSDLVWSPDGGALAFVSNRADHSFVGVYRSPEAPLSWMSPSTGFDSAPVWSPKGDRLAFARRPGEGGPPAPILKRVPHPWALFVADAASGEGHAVWRSGESLRDSFPDVAGEANLRWAGPDALTFLSEADDWPHLYAVSLKGGPARRLTPGPFMVEHVAASPDGRVLIYSANTGDSPDDDDRRHLFRVSVDGGAPVPLTRGEGLEWSPAPLAGWVAFIGADARRPPAAEVVSLGGGEPARLSTPGAKAYAPAADFVVPRQVSWTSPDGLVIHGQLFEAPASAGKRPGLIFVHGGPPRQMMLGWSYMDYYSNAYAMNQYYADHGFTVLSVNYRLGIGYGYDFQHALHGGRAGSSEYQDVLSGAQFLQSRPGVDPDRIGIWGGSYGGLLTALGLARNSDVFKAGVDLHGVHDWSRIGAEEAAAPPLRFEKGDQEEALAVAFKASPVADVARWTSPVLLIQGDDDRNVPFGQTIDLARRLRDQGTPYEELVFPNEIHGFLRYADWLRADAAAADFLARTLKASKTKAP